MENIKNKGLEIEVEGKTMEEALLKACKILKASRENLHIQIVSEEQRGLFGMAGAKPAKIIASLKCSKQIKKA